MLPTTSLDAYVSWTTAAAAATVAMLRTDSADSTSDGGPLTSSDAVRPGDGGGCGLLRENGADGNGSSSAASYSTLILVAPLSLFGLIGNCLVVLSFSRRGQRSSPAAAALFTALAVTDSFTILVCLAYEVSVQCLPLAAGGEQQDFVGVLNVVLIEAIQFAFTWSIWIIVLIASVRYQVVRRPDKASASCRVARMRSMIVLITALSLLLSIPAVFRYSGCGGDGGGDGGGGPKRTGCWGGDVMGRAGDECGSVTAAAPCAYRIVYSYAISLSASCLLPLVLLVLLSASLVRSLRRSGFVAASIIASRKSAFRSRQRRKKVTEVTVAVALLNLLSTVPCLLQAVVREECGSHSEAFRIAGAVTRTLLVLNSALDCVLFSFISKSFRRQCCALSDWGSSSRCERRATFRDDPAFSRQSMCQRTAVGQQLDEALSEERRRRPSAPTSRRRP